MNFLVYTQSICMLNYSTTLRYYKTVTIQIDLIFFNQKVNNHNGNEICLHVTSETIQLSLHIADDYRIFSISTGSLPAPHFEGKTIFIVCYYRYKGNLLRRSFEIIVFSIQLPVVKKPHDRIILSIYLKLTFVDVTQ